MLSSRFMNGLRLALGLAVLGVVVRAADGPDDHTNPASRVLFTLVDCDNTGLDTMMQTIYTAADDIVEALDAVLNGNTFGLDDNSKGWYTARNLRLLFGANYNDVPGQDGRLRFEGEYEDIVKTVRGRFQQVVDAIENDRWSPSWDFIICRPESDPPPFKKPRLVGDYIDGMPNELANTLLADNVDWADRVVYWRDSPFYSQSASEDLAGRRKVTMLTSLENVCQAAVDDDGDKPLAFRYSRSQERVQWMALCDSFWGKARNIENPDQGTDIERFQTQHSFLLHELMHMLQPHEIIDVKAKVGQMTEERYFYGWNAAVNLGIYRSDLALVNADNYRLFFESLEYGARRWDLPDVLK